MTSNQNRWINYLTGQYDQQTQANHNSFHSSSWIRVHSPPQDKQEQQQQQGMIIDDDNHNNNNNNKRKSIDLGNGNMDINVRNKKMFRQ